MLLPALGRSLLALVTVVGADLRAAPTQAGFDFGPLSFYSQFEGRNIFV
jgi:hypothetical protein